MNRVLVKWRDWHLTNVKMQWTGQKADIWLFTFGNVAISFEIGQFFLWLLQGYAWHKEITFRFWRRSRSRCRCSTRLRSLVNRFADGSSFQERNVPSWLPVNSTKPSLENSAGIREVRHIANYWMLWHSRHVLGSWEVTVALKGRKSQSCLFPCQDKV